MKRFLLILGTLAAVAGVLATTGSAASQPGIAHGTIAGSVSTPDGAAVPLAHVALRIETRSGRVYEARTFSDHRGEFHFREVPVGHGVVHAAHERAGRGDARVEVLENETTRVHVVLHHR
jgi:hypothetical protein